MLTTIEEAEEFFADPKSFLNKNNEEKSKEEKSEEEKSRTSSLSSTASARKVSLQNQTVEF
jgi:hypothetical protein